MKYEITKRDLEDADLLLRKLEHTQWEIKEAMWPLLRKYAYLSELANSLNYLPAMEEVSETVDDIARESRFRFESEISTFFYFKQFHDERIDPIRKHLYELGKDFREVAVVQGVVCEENTQEP